MDCVGDDLTERLVFMTCAQVAKTEFLLNVAGHAIDLDPSSMLFVLPTQKVAEDFSKERLAPMIRDTKELRRKVADVKSRSSGNTLRKKGFPGGYLHLVGANSAAELAGRPIRRVLMDEVDRYPSSAGTEGDPVKLATKRTAAFWNRFIGMVSTPTEKGFSRIEKEYEISSEGRYFVPCPHCGTHQVLEWRNLRYENNDPTTAAYLCNPGKASAQGEDGDPPKGCGALWTEELKPEVLAKGKWIHRHPERKVRGFHLNALYSPFLTWSEIVEEWLEIKGDREKLKVFTNTVLGETFEEDKERIDTTGLRERLEEYGGRTAEELATSSAPANPIVPLNAGVLTAAVDVQKDRLEVSVYGWGDREESWLVAWQPIHGDPSRSEVWDELGIYLSRGWKHEGGARLDLSAVMVDSGFLTSEVYTWVRSQAPARVFALKGIEGAGKALLSRASRANKWKVRVFTVGTVTAKDSIFARLKRHDVGPGYCHLPTWIDGEFLEQLTAEEATTVYRGGVPTRVYRKRRARNEALDLFVYNLAALYSLGPAVVQNLGIFVQRVLELGTDAGDEELAEEDFGDFDDSDDWVDSWR